MQSLTDIEKNSDIAFNFHKQLISLKKAMALAFLSMGKILKSIKDNKYYNTLGYKSFVDYVQSPEVGLNYRTAYYYVEIYEMFVERLGYTEEQLIEYSYDKLRKLLPIVKKENNTEKLMSRAKDLTWEDFDKIYKEDKKNEEYVDKLASPEFYRCSECGKWDIVIPISDCCPTFLDKFYELLKKRNNKKETFDKGNKKMLR